MTSPHLQKSVSIFLKKIHNKYKKWNIQIKFRIATLNYILNYILIVDNFYCFEEILGYCEQISVPQIKD